MILSPSGRFSCGGFAWFECVYLKMCDQDKIGILLVYWPHHCVNSLRYGNCADIGCGWCWTSLSLLCCGFQHTARQQWLRTFVLHDNCDSAPSAVWPYLCCRHNLDLGVCLFLYCWDVSGLGVEELSSYVVTGRSLDDEVWIYWNTWASSRFSQQKTKKQTSFDKLRTWHIYYDQGIFAGFTGQPKMLYCLDHLSPRAGPLSMTLCYIGKRV